MTLIKIILLTMLFFAPLTLQPGSGRSVELRVQTDTIHSDIGWMKKEQAQFERAVREADHLKRFEAAWENFEKACLKNSSDLKKFIEANPDDKNVKTAQAYIKELLDAYKTLKAYYHDRLQALKIQEQMQSYLSNFNQDVESGFADLAHANHKLRKRLNAAKEEIVQIGNQAHASNLLVVEDDAQSSLQAIAKIESLRPHIGLLKGVLDQLAQATKPIDQKTYVECETIIKNALAVNAIKSSAVQELFDRASQFETYQQILERVHTIQNRYSSPATSKRVAFATLKRDLDELGILHGVSKPALQTRIRIIEGVVERLIEQHPQGKIVEEESIQSDALPGTVRRSSKIKISKD